MKKLFLLIAAAMLMYSCGSDSETDIPEPKQKVGKGVRFSSSIEGSMLRSTGAWKPGDEIFVYMTLAEGPDATGEWFVYNQTPVTYVSVNGDGMFTPKTPEDELFFPEDGEAVNFVAYGPHAPFCEITSRDTPSLYLGLRDGIPVPGRVYVRRPSQEDQSKLDLITAKDLTPRTKDGSNVVQLEFGHRMSKLELSISVDGELVEDDLIDMQVHVYGLFNRAFNELRTPDADYRCGWLSLGHGEYNTMYFNVAAEGKFAEATLLPEGHLMSDDDVHTVPIIFELTNGEEYIWKFSPKVLLSGVKRKYNIILSKEREQKKVMQVGESTITDWVDAPVEDVIVK